ncbi:MAG: hypothetical protein O2923_03130 [Verrucomicrobia bacterium]|nr:hypothetical protein [Verrucomicrobiota bacterium]MDA1088551.1 hypothetical protein [Verrucomicrobiota bacterium]
MKIFLSPIARARGLRDDESGQVILVSGFMAFLIVVFVITTANTAQTVYRRTQVQIAADAAADAAGTWQARGVNLLQTLNNLHWIINAALYPVEIITCCCCSIGPVAQAACGASLGFCVPCCLVGTFCNAVCNACSPVDSAQEGLSDFIKIAEHAAISGTTKRILADASVYAAMNGADLFFIGGNTLPVTGAAGSYIYAVPEPPDPAGTSKEYDAVHDIFPLSTFVEASLDEGSMGYWLQTVVHKMPLFVTGGNPFHAALVLKSGDLYERTWVNILSDFTRDPNKAILLGFEDVQPGEMDFPWGLSPSMIEGCSLGNGDGWGDDDRDRYWEFVGIPHLTFMTSISRYQGGLLNFDPAGGATEDMTGMYWYLNPDDRKKISNPPHVAVATAKAHGEIAPMSMGGAGVQAAKGTLRPVELEGEIFTRKAIDIGIYH